MRDAGFPAVAFCDGIRDEVVTKEVYDMTKREFFIISIKLFGLYSLVMGVYSALAFNLVNLIQIGDLGLILVTTFSLVVMGALFWFLAFRADWIVDRLKLVKGLSDDRIEFGGLTAVQIAKAGIFLIGVFLIVKSIPLALSLAYCSVRGGISGMLMVGEDNSQLILKGIEILLGWLLATNFDWLAQRISPKSEQHTSA